MYLSNNPIRVLFSLVPGLLVSCFTLWCIFIPTTPALATGVPVVSMRPAADSLSSNSAYFVFSSKAGTHIESRVRVVNVGTATGTFSLTAVDATTAQSGGVVYSGGDRVAHTVGSWLKLSTTRVTLYPAQSIFVPFTVFVPANVRVGEHVGGIVAEVITPATPLAKSANVNMQVTTRSQMIVAVQIHIPGPVVEKFSVLNVRSSASPGYQFLLVTMHNGGTTMLKPKGSLVIQDASGRVLRKLALQLDTILPETTIDYPVYIQNKALSAGAYMTSLTMNYGHHGVLHQDSSFTITREQIHQTFPATARTLQLDNLSSLPTILILSAVLLVLTAGGSWIFMLRRKLATLEKTKNSL